MTAVLDDLESVKRKVQIANDELKKVEGMTEQVRKDRKKKFGVSSLKSAKREVKRLGKVERKKVEAYTRELKKWQEEYEPKLKKLIQRKSSTENSGF